jgi:hypothetical protein
VNFAYLFWPPRRASEMAAYGAEAGELAVFRRAPRSLQRPQHPRRGGRPGWHLIRLPPHGLAQNRLIGGSPNSRPQFWARAPICASRVASPRPARRSWWKKFRPGRADDLDHARRHVAGVPCCVHFPARLGDIPTGRRVRPSRSQDRKPISPSVTIEYSSSRVWRLGERERRPGTGVPQPRLGR